MAWRPLKLHSQIKYCGLPLALALLPVLALGQQLPTVAQVLGEPEDKALKPEQIEADGAVIGTVRIDNRNIFDLSNPEENKWLYRWANRLHIVSKPHVIKSQLLFQEGDSYSERLSDESERILRLNPYLIDAQIEPVAYEDGVVDLEVTTNDVWTLTPELSLSRSGGETEFGIGLLEKNLLGRGIQVGGQVKRTIDRDIVFLEYTDTNFLSDRYRLAANYSDNSDGYFRRLEFGKPFYALDRRRAGRLWYSEGEQIDQLYDRGDVVAEYAHEFDYHEAFVGLSRGLRGGWTKRYFAGIAYQKNVFGEAPDQTLPITIVPEDREYLYPFLGFEVLEDRYETTVNFDQIELTEDRFVGTWFNARLGYSDEGSASTSNAWHYFAGFSNTLMNTNTTSLTVSSNLRGRFERGEPRNNELFAVARYHRRLTENQLFYLSLSGTVGKNLDIDNPLYLGGDTGLRGYPLRYQNGESKALLTLEHRLFTEWYPWRLFRVGAAVFFDAGKVWGESPVGVPNLGVLKDIGVGLRLGSTRLGNAKVVHIDLAFPLDGEDDIDSVQILVSAKSSF